MLILGCLIVLFLIEVAHLLWTMHIRFKVVRHNTELWRIGEFLEQSANTIEKNKVGF